MKKQAITSSGLSDVEIKDLEELLGAFGSQFSLEDIASAYCKSKRDVIVAADIICSMNETILGSAIDASKYKLEGATALELASDSVLQKSYHEENNTGVSPSKCCTVSMGTVSDVIGKEYIKTKSLPHNTCEPNKPVTLDLKEFPVSEIRHEEVPLNMTPKHGSMLAGVEEFLFKMLGDGFQLDLTMIKEVLGSCGYDMQKSMENLIELSAMTLKKCDDIVDVADEKSSENCPGQEPYVQQKQRIHQDSDQSDGDRSTTRNLTVSHKRGKNLQKEVLESLFCFPERSVEAPKISTVTPVRRSRAFGQPVLEPYKDTVKERITAEPKKDARDEHEDYENSYEALRKAVKEYWITMREYNKAAVDAFIKGDHARANKLLEQGQIFIQKVLEADRKSAEKIVEARNEEEITLDWHAVKPKEAVRLLRIHLSRLSGIATIKHLKIIVGTNDEDSTKEARKGMIKKELEKESVGWTDDGNGQAILIQVDVIDPKRLSFFKNS